MELKLARVFGKNLPISFKKSVEVARFIKYLPIHLAKKYLQEVIELKRPVPFRRYKRDVPHRRELQGYPVGRYPVKVCKYFLKLLNSLEKNAQFLGLDTSRLFIIHASAHKGPKILGRIRTRTVERKNTHVLLIGAVIEKYDPNKKYKRKQLEEMCKEFIRAHNLNF